MKTCRVIGTVVSTAKHPDYDVLKLLVIEPVSLAGEPVGEPQLAVDRAQAGIGDTVLVLCEGNGIRQLFRRDRMAVQAAIVGIVDQIEVP